MIARRSTVMFHKRTSEVKSDVTKAIDTSLSKESQGPTGGRVMARAIH
jgi:hypothetical protein